jgi:hypothetical protein
VARDPAEIAATLGELVCLDLVELGQQAVLERIVQAAATCCGSTGGVGLLLLNPDQQLHYVAAAGRPRRALAGSQVRLGQGPSVDAFLEDAQVASRDLAGESRWPNFRPLALAAGIRSWLSAPVRQRHGPIGVLDFARIDPQPWQPGDLATAAAFTRLIVTTLQLATAHQQQALSPALRLPWNMTPASSKPATSSWSGNGSTRSPRSSCCASRPRSRINQSEPSPNASFPAPELDLHLPSFPPRWVAGGWHRTAAPPRGTSKAKSVSGKGTSSYCPLPASRPPWPGGGPCRPG